MYYTSTRDKNVRLSDAEAILKGLSDDGGLLVPSEFPRFATADIELLRKMTYPQRAASVMELFLPDFTRDELYGMAKAAYGADKWDGGLAAPVRKLDGATYALELWHGPTCAFKDIALQMLPRLLSASLGKTGETRDVCILVATSGDTGKAALEGFRDVPRVKIAVFFPRDGVSDVQKLQMTTQEGGNVGVASVGGNFDDAQSGVKRIFSDAAFRAELNAAGLTLSSANSINWGRLLPQIAYYFSAYCDLVNAGELETGDPLDFVVPTGNFGNILAGYYARKMGLPIWRLVCASNKNDVLTEFINTGRYNAKRGFYATSSPSMDILVSSNLERLLFDLSGEDDALISGYMKSLAESGGYTVNDDLKGHISDLFTGIACDEAETSAQIAELRSRFGYLADTHTAVGFGALKKLREADGAAAQTVVVSTASPYKFCGSVIEALGGQPRGDGFELLGELESLTGTEAPRPLRGLLGKTARFGDCVAKDEMADWVKSFLGM
ncbi:MAG: threonine synthase [Oscillospiraceae bacterium]|jgi:threonine synthase|nr:threonine synthase [Oscillospiraceae bacterium]